MNTSKAGRKINWNQGEYCLEVPQPKQSTGVALRRTACCEGSSSVAHSSQKMKDCYFLPNASPACSAFPSSQSHLPCISSSSSPDFFKSAPLRAKVWGFKQPVGNNKLLCQLWPNFLEYLSCIHGKIKILYRSYSRTYTYSFCYLKIISSQWLLLTSDLCSNTCRLHIAALCTLAGPGKVVT